MSSMEQIKCTIYVNYPRIWSWTLHWESSQSTDNRIYHKSGKRKEINQVEKHQLSPILQKWNIASYIICSCNEILTPFQNISLSNKLNSLLKSLISWNRGSSWLTSNMVFPDSLSILIILVVDWDHHLRTCLSHENLHLLLTHLNRNQMVID